MHIWRERLERWFQPAALRCPLSPNVISVIALLTCLAGALCLALAAHKPVLFLVAPPLLAVGGLLDSFDGIVARVQNRTSSFGDFLDHVFDRVADLGLLVGWCIGARVRTDLALVTLACVGLHGYLGTQIEASFGKRTYEGTGRGEYVMALITLPLIAYVEAQTVLANWKPASLSINEWATAILAVMAFLALQQRFRLAMRWARNSPPDAKGTGK